MGGKSVWKDADPFDTSNRIYKPFSASLETALPHCQLIPESVSGADGLSGHNFLYNTVII